MRLAAALDDGVGEAGECLLHRPLRQRREGGDGLGGPTVGLLKRTAGDVVRAQFGDGEHEFLLVRLTRVQRRDVAVDALEQGRGSTADVVAALADARVVVAVVAVLGEGEEHTATAGDKQADMALVTLTRPDGRRALPVFSSTTALAAWDASARPVPVDTRRAAHAALAEGCERLVLDVAGPTTFVVSNDGAKDVSEFEVLDGSRILVEAENVSNGIERSVSVTLTPGTYETTCPGGTTAETGTLTVTGDADGDAATQTADATAAVATYREFLEAQTALLTQRVGAFAAAVKAGDVAKSKALFASTREPYERIEPVAEAFGDLDPKIDIRINDVAEGDEFTGFHRIEQGLWTTGSTKGLAPIADQLVHDVAI